MKIDRVPTLTGNRTLQISLEEGNFTCALGHVQTQRRQRLVAAAARASGCKPRLFALFGHGNGADRKNAGTLSQLACQNKYCVPNCMSSRAKKDTL